MARTRKTPTPAPATDPSAPSATESEGAVMLAPPVRRISATEFVREEPLTATLRGIVTTVYPDRKLTLDEWRALLTQTLQRPTT